MPIALLLAVLAAVACSQQACAEPAPQGLVRGLLTACVAAFVALTAVAVSLRFARFAAGDRRQYVQRRRRWRQMRCAHCMLYLAGAAAIVGWLRWPHVVRLNLGLDGWLLIDDVLILTPIILPAAVSLAAFSSVERALADVAAPQAGPNRQHQAQAFLARYYAGLFAAPVLLALAACDLVDWISPARDTAVGQGLILLPLLLLFVAIQPLLLPMIWRTQRLHTGRQRSRLLAVARRGGLRLREVWVWRTGGRIANAAVAGSTPWLRCLFVSDALLDELADDELEMVLLHEAAHVRRRHIALRVLVLLLPLWWWLTADFALDLGAASTAILAGAGGAQAPLALLAAFALAAYAWLALGGCSRKFEHDADLVACGFARRGAADCAEQKRRVAALVLALNKLGEFCGDRSRRNWLHPSIDQRIALLQRALADGRFARRRLLETDVLAASLFGLTAAPLALLLLST